MHVGRNFAFMSTVCESENQNKQKRKNVNERKL